MCMYRNGAACECDIRDKIKITKEGIMRPAQESESKQPDELETENKEE